LYGCAAPGDSPRTPSSGVKAGNSSGGGANGSGEPVATFIDARPAAMVNGQMVGWGDLRPSLTESAGGQALHDAIIDQCLARDLEKLGVTITDQDARDEQQRLLDSLDATDANRALRLLDEVRRREGMGRQRFQALLTRNAGLRRLVREQVNVTEEAVRRMHDIQHGAHRQARVITVPNVAEAQQALTRIRNGESFAAVAAAMSTDSSATTGGLLDPISMEDPTWPLVLRTTLFRLSPGAMSDPVMLEEGYAIILLVQETAADDVTIDEARPALEKLVRLQQERVLMNRLARSYIEGSTITVFDAALKDAWERWRPEEN